MKKMQLSKELLRKDTPVMRTFCMLDISTVLGDTIPRETAGTYEKRAFSPLPKSTPFVDTATLTVVGRGCAGAEHIMTLLDTYCALLGGALLYALLPPDCCLLCVGPYLIWFVV